MQDTFLQQPQMVRGIHWTGLSQPKGQLNAWKGNKDFHTEDIVNAGITFKKREQFLGIESSWIYETLSILNGSGTHSLSYCSTISTTYNIHKSVLNITRMPGKTSKITSHRMDNYTTRNMQSEEANRNENETRKQKYRNNLQKWLKMTPINKIR